MAWSGLNDDGHSNLTYQPNKDARAPAPVRACVSPCVRAHACVRVLLCWVCWERERRGGPEDTSTSSPSSSRRIFCRAKQRLAAGFATRQVAPAAVNQLRTVASKPSKVQMCRVCASSDVKYSRDGWGVTELPSGLNSAMISWSLSGS